MSELRYPNESREYRDARDALLKDEQELADKVKAVAEKRRKLPAGGKLKEDYVFEWASTRCGRIGISWTSRRRGGPTFPFRRKSSGPNSWKSTI
jgi:hypothetical protein